MVSVDLYKSWPSIRRRSGALAPAVDPACSTTLDGGVLGAQTARRADAGRVADLLSQLVTEIARLEHWDKLVTLMYTLNQLNS